MRKIIIATHHRLAEGMKDTIQYILPDAGEIIAISAYLTNTPIEEEISSVLDGINYQEDEVIVFTDMLGGSVNQTFSKHLKNKNIHIVTGINLPVVTAILFELEDSFVNPDTIREAVNYSREQLVYMNDFMAEQSTHDEEDE
ncbi:hypothetical protein VSX61_10995 [Brenneria populi subsp. brevivirga]|uniref:PTS sugar transporter subunit IIA n=1 Tax=Brenneria populi TaxID=1505588 RepID=UPI002E188436|nr:hypothetical protein [Brenneria populi subsp. brevivirga]